MSSAQKQRKRQPRKSSSPNTPPQKPVSRRFFWLATILTAACVVTILWLTIGKVPITNFGFGPRILLILILLISIIASLASTEIIPWRSRSFADWRQPKVLGIMANLVLAAVSAVAGLASAFDPPQAEQETLLETKAAVDATRLDASAIRKGQVQIADAVGVGEQSLILRKISGTWGEVGCAVTYRFVLAERALKISSLKSEAGMQPYNPEYSITADRNEIAPSGERTSTLETVEAKGFWPGFAVQFRYATDGSNERLVWNHRKMSTVPLELVRC